MEEAQESCQRGEAEASRRRRLPTEGPGVGVEQGAREEEAEEIGRSPWRRCVAVAQERGGRDGDRERAWLRG